MALPDKLARWRIKWENVDENKTRKCNWNLNDYHFQPVWLSPPPQFELPCKETCSHIRWPHGATVALPALVLGCGQRERCPASILACVQVGFDFGRPQRTNQYYLLPLAFTSRHIYCLPNVCAFCKFCFLFLQCYFAHYWLSWPSLSLWWYHSVVICSTSLETSEALMCWKKRKSERLKRRRILSEYSQFATNISYFARYNSICRTLI